MPLKLRVFDRAEPLLKGLSLRLDEIQRVQSQGARRQGIPRPIPVLAPTSQLADWLQIRLARERGLSMGFEFPSVSDYLRRELPTGDGSEELAKSLDYWSPEKLRWQLLPRLDEFSLSLGHPATEPLRSRDRFAFAELLSAQFDRYARHRPDWIVRWANGKNSGAGEEGADLPDEAWQRALWSQLALAPSAPRPPAAFLACTSPADSGEGKRVLVFGTDLLDPLLLLSLHRLSESGHVIECFLLLPSLGYLGDVRRRQALLTAKDSSKDGEVDTSGHPLLASMGRHAVGTFLLLESLSPDYHEWPEMPPGEPSNSEHLLRRLQEDVRKQRLPAGVPREEGGLDERLPVQASDHSLRVHCCHSPRRELEVLRDELLRAFRDFPDLQADQVLIAVSDFDVYAPLAESILTSGSTALPLRLTAIPAREANPVMVALLALLRLAMGRQALSEVIELLTLRAVQEKLGLAGSPADVERLAEALRASGLTHGLGLGVEEPATEGTWVAALDRHLAGYWMGNEPEALDAEGRYLHPLASDLSSHEDLLLEFIAWLQTVARHLVTWRKEAPAKTWAERLLRIVDETLASDELDDAATAARRLFTELEMVDAETPLDVGAILDWLQPRLDNATSLRTSIGGEILLGRPDQLHGLPCRVFAFLGLQDGAFPRSSQRPAWDLLAHAPEAWDPNTRTRDRQIFLDSLLTPSDRLILCASNRSLRSAHDTPLSSCVEELLRVTEATARPASASHALREWLVVRHPIQPFSPDYFVEKGSALSRSFDPTAARIARDLRHNTTQLNAAFCPADFTRPAVSLPRELRLRDFLAFWKDPARAWLQAMEVELPGEEIDDSKLDDSPLSLDPLQGYTADESILESLLAVSATEAPRALDQLKFDRALQVGALGELEWTKRKRELESLAENLRPLLSQVDRHAITLSFANLPPLVGEIRLGRTEGGETWLLVYRPGKMDKPRYLLEAYLLQLIGSAHGGAAVTTRLFGTDCPEGWTIPGTSPETARSVLPILLQTWQLGLSRPLCFAPETSVTLAEELATGDETSALQAAARAWWAQPYGGAAGEGHQAAAQLVWRDLDPFSADFADEWVRQARELAAPLVSWKEGGAT